MAMDVKYNQRKGKWLQPFGFELWVIWIENGKSLEWKPGPNSLNNWMASTVPTSGAMYVQLYFRRWCKIISSIKPENSNLGNQWPWRRAHSSLTIIDGQFKYLPFWYRKNIILIIALLQILQTPLHANNISPNLCVFVELDCSPFMPCSESLTVINVKNKHKEKQKSQWDA